MSSGASLIGSLDAYPDDVSEEELSPVTLLSPLSSLSSLLSPLLSSLLSLLFFHSLSLSLFFPPPPPFFSRLFFTYISHARLDDV